MAPIEGVEWFVQPSVIVADIVGLANKLRLVDRPTLTQVKSESKMII